MFTKKCINYVLLFFTILLLNNCNTANLNKKINTDASINNLEHGILITKEDLNPEFGLANAGKQYRIKYSSISGLDKISKREDSAALFIPKGLAPKNGWPLIVWTHGTIGINDNCAPSLNKRKYRDSRYLNTWIALGFAVLAPDYPGLGSEGIHPYLNTRSEAFSVLDSILSLKNNFPISDKIFLVGQSQGSHAAFATSLYQQDYAPNLNFKFIILTGAPYFSNRTLSQELLAKQLATNTNYKTIAYSIYLYLSAKQLHPNLKAENYFDKRIIPFIEMGNKTCIIEFADILSKTHLPIHEALKPQIIKLLRLPEFQYKQLKVKSPIFVGTGTADVDVDPESQRIFVQDLLQAGDNVTQFEYEGLDHDETLNTSLRDSVPLTLKYLKK